MKSITLKQPWASLISSGRKTIETRVWPTKHRGALLICAGAGKPPTVVTALTPASAGPLPRGVALCIVDVIDCRPMTDADEKAACCERYPRAWSWVLANVRAVEPVAITGKQKLFTVDDSLIRLRPRESVTSSVADPSVDASQSHSG
jgi:hypothetical protein